MQILTDANAEKCYDWARYVTRGLLRGGHLDLVAKVTVVNDELRRSYRAAQDLTGPVEDARADREYYDGILDDSARAVRLKLAAVEPGADRRAPYLKVFPKGIDEYTKAKLAEQVENYTLLCTRLVANLPATDPLVMADVPTIQRQLADWTAAVAAINEATADLDTASAVLATAIDSWRKALLEVYGILLGRVGKAKAERLFPRKASRKPPAEIQAPQRSSGALPPDAEATG